MKVAAVTRTCRDTRAREEDDGNMHMTLEQVRETREDTVNMRAWDGVRYVNMQWCVRDSGWRVSMQEGSE